MTKKELREAYFRACKLATSKDDKPSVMDVITCANVFAHVMDAYPEIGAKKHLGTEVCDLVKSCTKVKKQEIEVDATKLLNAIDYYEKEGDE